MGRGGLATLTTHDIGAGTGPRSAAIADYDLDGNLDIATSLSTPKTVLILLGNGAGSFPTKLGWFSGHSGAALLSVDFNADGSPDVVCSSSAGVLTLTGDGLGGLCCPTTIDATPSSDSDASAIDINSDGHEDLILGGKLYLAQGAGSFAPSMDIPGGNRVPPGDADGDGQLDVYTIGGTFSTKGTLYLGDGNGAFFESDTFDSVPIVRGMMVDTDLDGRLDVVATGGGFLTVVRNVGAHASSYSYGNGKPGSFGTPALATSPPKLGHQITITATNGLPSASPVLFVGAEQASLPFDEGHLYVKPVSIVVLPPFDLMGVAQVTALLGDPTLCGVKVFMQAFFLDPGASGVYGTAQTNGVAWTVGL